VAAGAVARKWLRLQYGTTFTGWMSALGEIEIPFDSADHIAANPFFAPNAAIVPQLEAHMDSLRKAGDSCGARIEVRARGVPVGLGEPLFDKLDADIAYAMMGINAVKGVEIGDGFGVVAQRGSAHGDELTPQGFASNHAGGVLGGIATGQDLVVRIAIKPTSSIRLPKASIDRAAARPPWWRPSAATTPAWASAPRPSPRPAGAGGDGPRAAPPGAVWRRGAAAAAHCGAADLTPACRQWARPGSRGLRRFGALTFTYFAAIGLFNPYAPLWFQSLGFSTLVIGAIASLQSWTRIVAPYAWSWAGDHSGRRTELIRVAAVGA
jgi:hypothetical protein